MRRVRGEGEEEVEWDGWLAWGGGGGEERRGEVGWGIEVE